MGNRFLHRVDVFVWFLYYSPQTGGLLFMATTRKNVAPSLVLELIARVAAVAKVCDLFSCI
jgi:hypothetical protein